MWLYFSLWLLAKELFNQKRNEQKFIQYWLTLLWILFLFFFSSTQNNCARFFSRHKYIIFGVTNGKCMVSSVIISFFFSFVLFIRYFNVKSNCYPYQLFNNVNFQLYSSWRPSCHFMEHRARVKRLKYYQILHNVKLYLKVLMK